MSLILDALRKMEQDRKSRRGAAQDIRPEVLRYRAAAQPQQAKPYLLVTVALVLLAAGIGAGIFMKGNRPVPASKGTGQAAIVAETAPVTTPAQPAPIAAPATPALPTAPTAQTAPLAPASTVVQPTAPAAKSPVPVAAPQAPAVDLAKREPVPVAAPVEPSRSRPVKKGAAAARRARVEAAESTRAKPLEREVPQTFQAPSDISISGIAYQDERRLRRAVVNGVLVGEGADIAGARVVEIKESKVKLFRDGQMFDVHFTSGLSSR